ncbi:hypothetical protein M433DRAFT_134460 [Acidomyces richmondensis BFW]|nr:hypothetical protein M433DRAFT_134460 [Acidomyces richmondensis BFW]
MIEFDPDWPQLLYTVSPSGHDYRSMSQGSDVVRHINDVSTSAPAPPTDPKTLDILLSLQILALYSSIFGVYYLDDKIKTRTSDLLYCDQISFYNFSVVDWMIETQMLQTLVIAK